MSDSRGVTPPDVEVVGLAGLLTSRDDINGDAASCPNIVEVDTCGHDRDQNVVRAQLGDIDDLWLKGGSGIAESLTADDLGVHLVG